jgi:hypothetical protein
MLLHCHSLAESENKLGNVTINNSGANANCIRTSPNIKFDQNIFGGSRLMRLYNMKVHGSRVSETRRKIVLGPLEGDNQDKDT